MQVSPYQAWDAGDALSNSELRNLSDSGCRRNFIIQEMQESLYQTADAGETLSDRRCSILSIKKRMQESLHQTADAGDTPSESLYQTAGAGDTLRHLM